MCKEPLYASSATAIEQCPGALNRLHSHGRQDHQQDTATMETQRQVLYRQPNWANIHFRMKMYVGYMYYSS